MVPCLYKIEMEYQIQSRSEFSTPIRSVAISAAKREINNELGTNLDPDPHEINTDKFTAPNGDTMYRVKFEIICDEF